MTYKAFTVCLLNINWPDWITASVAVVAAVSAFFSYRLSKRIYDEIKSDEALVPSRVRHPDLAQPDYDKNVLCFTLFNRSHRKSVITGIEVFDYNSKKIEITWSNSIDQFGNIQNPTGTLVVKDSAEFFIRSLKDGSFVLPVTIHLKHSFDNKELVIVYCPLGD